MGARCLRQNSRHGMLCRSTIYGVRMFRHLGFAGIDLLPLAGVVPTVRDVVGVGTAGGGFRQDAVGE